MTTKNTTTTSNVQAAGVPARDEEAGQVPSTEGGRFGQCGHIVLHFRTHSPQQPGHFGEPGAAGGAQADESGSQRFVIDADEVSEQMEFGPAKLGRDFDPSNNFDRTMGGRSGWPYAGRRVVVGDGDRHQPGSDRPFGQGCGGVRAVAEGGVKVQIGPARIADGRKNLTESRERGTLHKESGVTESGCPSGGVIGLTIAATLWTRKTLSRTPLTNAGESFDP